MKWLLLSILVLSTVLGDLLQSSELRLANRNAPESPGLKQVVSLIARRRYLLFGVMFMGVSFFAFLAMVQTEPISFVIPASAGSFVLETILAKFVLREHLTYRRVGGALLVLAGIVLIAR